MHSPNQIQIVDRTLTTVYIDFHPLVMVVSVLMPFLPVLLSQWINPAF